MYQLYIYNTIYIFIYIIKYLYIYIHIIPIITSHLWRVGPLRSSMSIDMLDRWTLLGTSVGALALRHVVNQLLDRKP